MGWGELPSGLGVNVFGYFYAESGVGEHSRQLLEAVRRAGLSYAAVPYTRTLTRQRHPFEDAAIGPPDFPINIVAVNADELPHFARDVGPDFLEARYSIGLWAWEIEEFPESMARSQAHLDEVWANSGFSAKAIQRKVDRPVYPFPLPVSVRETSTVRRSELRLPNGFLFLFCFDFDSIFERKNPIAVVKAFQAAFPSHDQVFLMVKSINGQKFSGQLELLRSSVGGDSRISIIDAYWSADRQRALMSSCDAYVSLHRAEGFGLTMAEAMAYGRPVIATAYSGNLDFMTDRNSFLVPVRQVEIPAGCGPYPKGATWSEPDVEAAARLMRHVYSSPAEAARKAEQGKADIESKHSPEARARFIRQRIEAVQRRLPARSRAAKLPGLDPGYLRQETPKHYTFLTPRNYSQIARRSTKPKGTTELTACTIVSNNYLAFARVFSDSFLAHHPSGEVFVLVVDEPAARIDYGNERFQVVFAGELGIPAFDHFAFKYSLLELNTAVKPFFLDHLRSRFGRQSLLYFDPDIVVFDDLTELFADLRTSNLLLTPHILEPLADGFRPSERNFLLSGIFNLGFLGIRFNQHTIPFLSWWKERLYSHCFHRVAEGLFVDQRWMDFAPAFLPDVKILRDPGCNVAYWNLAQRFPVRDSRGWRVVEGPLRFFHFSGIQPDDLDKISKYQDRYSLYDRPELRPLFKDYRAALLDADLESTKSLRYAYGFFDNGVAVPEVARLELQRRDSEGKRWPRPFDSGGADSYYVWLTDATASDRGNSLPRIALLLWDLRADLQQAFADPLGDDHAAYVDWLLSGEPLASGVEAAFFSTLSAERPSSEGMPSPKPPTQASIPRSRIDLLAMDAGYEQDRTPLIPRMAMMIREQRADLREAFPSPLGQSRLAFSHWYVTYAWREYELPEALVIPTLQSMPMRSRLRAELWRWLARLGCLRVSPRGSWQNLGSRQSRPNP